MFENTKKFLEGLGEEVIEEYRKKLSAPDPHPSIATRTLYENVNYKVTVDTNALFLYFTAPDQYFDKKTGELFLEQGRKPGSTPPPINVIKKWVIDKNLPHNPYAVKYAIARDGIPAKPYLKQIKDDIRSTIAKRIEEAIKKDVFDLIKNMKI